MSPTPDRPLERTRLESADLGAAWEKHAAEFIAWAREPGHDSYWLFHRDQFLELLPPPGRPDSGIVRPRSRRWQRIPLFLHLRALKPR